MHIENFKLVLDTIKATPENWKQDEWHTECGTKHCFFGWAQVLAGKPVNTHTVRRDARKFLDLSTPEASYLSHYGRTLEDFMEFYLYGLPERVKYNDSGYDFWGYDRDGYNSQGLDRNNKSREYNASHSLRYLHDQIKYD